MAYYHQTVNWPVPVDITGSVVANGDYRKWSTEQQQAWLAFMCAGDALVKAFKDADPVESKSLREAWGPKSVAVKLQDAWENDDAKPDGHAFVNDNGVDVCMHSRTDGSICAWSRRYHDRFGTAADDGGHTGVDTYSHTGVKALTSWVPEKPIAFCGWCGARFEPEREFDDLCSDECIASEYKTWKTASRFTTKK